MLKTRIIKISYWLLASVLIAFLIQNSLPFFWHAWLIALFLLPVVFIVKIGIEKTKHLKGFKKWLRYFFLSLVSLYWGYIAIVIAYWYFLELKSDTIEEIIINPIFIWMIISFFVLLELVLFKKYNQKESKIISIYSNRKKTILKISTIAYIESRNNFTVVILNNGSEYKNTIKISEWEFKLNNFLRIHRAFLVNPEAITLNGNEVIVNTTQSLPISRSYKQKVLNHFKNKPIAK